MNKHYRDSFIPESDKSMTRFISRTMSRHMSGAVSRHMSRSVSPADQALLAKFGKYSERTDSNSRARESESNSSENVSLYGEPWIYGKKSSSSLRNQRR